MVRSGAGSPPLERPVRRAPPSGLASTVTTAPAPALGRHTHDRGSGVHPTPLGRLLFCTRSPTPCHILPLAAPLPPTGTQTPHRQRCSHAPAVPRGTPAVHRAWRLSRHPASCGLSPNPGQPAGLIALRCTTTQVAATGRVSRETHRGRGPQETPPDVRRPESQILRRSTAGASWARPTGVVDPLASGHP